MSHPNKPLGARHPRVLWSRLKVRWPFFIWMILVGVLYVLMDHVNTDGAMPGVIEKVSEKVASTNIGRIDRILVEPGQHVEAGDVVAVLTSELVEARIMEEQSQINTSLMQAEVESVRTGQRYDQIIFGLDSDIQTRESQLENDKAELGVLTAELLSLQPLVDDKLINPETLSSLRTRKETLARSIEIYPSTISKLKSKLAEAESLKEAAQKSLNIEVFREELEGSSNLSALELERGSLTLKAARSGVVTEVSRRVGEVVQPGQTIVTIVDNDPMHVISLLPEKNARSLEPGKMYLMHGDFDPNRMYKTKLTKIMPDIIGLTRAGTLMPDRTIRGRSLLFEILDTEHNLLPGESVTLRTDRSVLMKVKEKVSKLSPGEK